MDEQIENIEIPNVSKFIDNTVDDLLNYYLKNETYSKEEVKAVINSRINEIVNGAPEAFDTLKEIADYIAEHEEIAKALNEAIGNKVDKETGKSLISDTEIERLASVDNYDDTEVRQKITAIETEQITQNETIEENTNKIIANTEEIAKLKEENEVLKSQIPVRTSRGRKYYFDR